MEEKAPENWVRIDESTFKHTIGCKIDIGETQGGWYRVDLVTDSKREPIGDGETLREAREVALEMMEEPLIITYEDEDGEEIQSIQYKSDE